MPNVRVSMQAPGCLFPRDQLQANRDPRKSPWLLASVNWLAAAPASPKPSAAHRQESSPAALSDTTSRSGDKRHPTSQRQETKPSSPASARSTPPPTNQASLLLF